MESARNIGRLCHKGMQECMTYKWKHEQEQGYCREKALNSALQEMDTDSMTAEDAMDTLGGLCAEILSHNMTGEQVTTKEITDDYDTEEMEALIDAYMEFAGGIKNNPN